MTGPVVAIACPGPSLGVTWPTVRPLGDIIIAVNHAAELVQDMDYWAFADARAATLVNHPTIGPRAPRVGFITDASTSRNWRRDWNAKVVDWHKDYLHPFGRAGANYTGPAAAAFALTGLEAAAIHVAGCDLRSELDWAGRRGANRKADRWRKEARQWRRILAFCRERGCHLIRHSPRFVHAGFGDHEAGT